MSRSQTPVDEHRTDPPGPAGPDCVAPFENADTAAPSTPEVSATAVDGTRDVDVVVDAVAAGRPRWLRWRARWFPMSGVRRVLEWWDRD